jgi:radical SAM protein with 4Fe4S-binding SPASM domain
VELTHRCHLDCVHCYLEDNHDHGAKSHELTEAEWCGLIDELAAAGCLFLTFSGGEIFLRRDTLAVARHARRRGLAVRFYTSGTIMPPGLAEEIAALQPLSVEFSLYAAYDARRHDAIVGLAGSHRKTLEAIRRLAALSVPVVIKTPLMGEIFSEYPGIIRLAESLGAAYLLDPAITPKNDGTPSPCLHRLEPEQLTALYADGALPVADEIRRLREGAGRRDPDGEICNLGKTGCAVSPFGDVYPTLGFPWSAGNVREAPFELIWRESPLLRKIREAKVRDLHTCSGCEKNAYCGRCCMWALMDDGDFYGASSWACQVAEAKERAAGMPSAPSPYQLQPRAVKLNVSF